MNEDKIFRDIERLRDPGRLAVLETERVVSFCLEGSKMANVLDIGTGSGVFAEAFARRGPAVTGVDIQPAMLAAAVRFVPRARFLAAASENLPFKDGSFGLGFLGLVLHEASRPLRTLQEAHRVCVSRVAVLEWPYVECEPGPPLEHRLRANDIERWGESAGFSRIRTIPMEHLVLFLMKK